MPALPQTATGQFSAVQVETVAFVAMEKLLANTDLFAPPGRGDAEAAGADAAQIAVLKTALAEAGKYLRSLPLHAETHRQASKVENLLRDIDASLEPRRIFSGTRYTPAGECLLEARVMGAEVTIHTTSVEDKSAEAKQRHINELYNALKEGVKIGLTFRSDADPVRFGANECGAMAVEFAKK